MPAAQGMSKPAARGLSTPAAQTEAVLFRATADKTFLRTAPNYKSSQFVDNDTFIEGKVSVLRERTVNDEKWYFVQQGSHEGWMRAVHLVKECGKAKEASTSWQKCVESGDTKLRKVPGENHDWQTNKNGKHVYVAEGERVQVIQTKMVNGHKGHEWKRVQVGSVKGWIRGHYLR